MKMITKYFAGGYSDELMYFVIVVHNRRDSQAGQVIDTAHFFKIIFTFSFRDFSPLNTVFNEGKFRLKEIPVFHVQAVLPTAAKKYSYKEVKKKI